MDAMFHWTGMVVWLGISLAFGLFCLGLIAEFLGNAVRRRTRSGDPKDGYEGGNPYL